MVLKEILSYGHASVNIEEKEKGIEPVTSIPL